MIATTSGDAKAPELRGLGADEVNNYRKGPDWAAEVRKLTAGSGVQLVLEIGGAGTFSQSLKAVGFGGELAFVGTRAEGGRAMDPNAIFRARATVRPLVVGSRAQFTAM